MNRLKADFVGYLLFTVTISFNCLFVLIVYTHIEKNYYKVLAIISFILFSSLICSIIDYLRRKIMIEKPVKEIREATEKMTSGNFNINLRVDNSISNYTMYDKIKEDINALALELSKNEILKTDFIANVSHEIKTPLAIINNYAKALKAHNIDDDTKEKYLNIISEATNKLSSLVSNILKLNKLENQELYPEYKKFNLSETLTDIILQFEDLLDKKDIQLDCEINEDIIIESEESYLEIIWSNLISNAIKFTEDKIKISLKEVEEKIVFTIEDNGCGIDSITGKHIFDKFYQGDTSHASEGNGLGLALVKEVIDIIGGDIFVESEVGVGTKFTVQLKK